MSTTTGPLRSRRPRVVTAAVGALVAALLAGCGGGSSEEPEDASTASASPSTEASSAFPDEAPSADNASDEESEDTAEAEQENIPLPKAPKARNSQAGRVAFVEFVVERWGYALTTNDASALSDLSARGSTCRGCKELATELAKRKKQGWYVDFPGAQVSKVSTKPAGPRTFDATATIDIPASQSYFEDGTYRNENEAFKDAKFIVTMTLTKTRWTLGSFRVA